MPHSIVVTGGSGTIGGAVVQSLLALGCHVIIAGRNSDAIASAATHFSALPSTRFSGGWVKAIAVDVNSAASVQRFAAQVDATFPQGLDTLVNNAAYVSDTYAETPDGVELMWSTNVLGYYSVVSALLPTLARAATKKGRISSRIINVASDYAGDLDLEDLQWSRRGYDPHKSYRASKAADRLLTVAVAELLRSAPGAPPITLWACHPGVIGSKVYNALVGGTIITKWRDALKEKMDVTIVHLAIEREATTQKEVTASGGYFDRVMQRKPCRFASDEERGRREQLLGILEAQHGARFNAPPHPLLRLESERVGL